MYFFCNFLLRFVPRLLPLYIKIKYLRRKKRKKYILFTYNELSQKIRFQSEPIATLCLYNIQRENLVFKDSLCIIFSAWDHHTVYTYTNNYSYKLHNGDCFCTHPLKRCILSFETTGECVRIQLDTTSLS